MFVKQGRKSQKGKASKVEERRETGKGSIETSKGETSGHLPGENRQAAGTIQHCNANTLGIR